MPAPCSIPCDAQCEMVAANVVSKAAGEKLARTSFPQKLSIFNCAYGWGLTERNTGATGMQCVATVVWVNIFSHGTYKT